MLVHPEFNAVAFEVGPLKVHWYGLTYLVAFAFFYALGSVRVAKPWFANAGWTRRDIEDMLFYGVLGVVLGGRLGYVLFYKFPDNPLDVVAVWKGGMSFHGGLLGVLLAMAWYGRRHGRRFFEVTDLIAPCVPVGIAAVRIGNFINGELWGRFADPSLPWAMVFPQSGSPLPRHPSQIYQALGEGLTLFVLMWWFGRTPRPLGQVSGMFLLGYGVLRFCAEYFREPDSFLMDLQLATGMSMGQWLSLPMVLGGVLILAWSARRAAR